MNPDRDSALRRALDAITTGATAVIASTGAVDPWADALDAFAASWRLDHEAALRHAQRAAAALPADGDATALVLVRAMLALASAGTGIAGRWTDAAPGHTPTGDPLADAVVLLDELDDSDAACFARYAVGEAALACARIDLATRSWSAPERFRGALAGHPFETVMAVLAARVAAFAGRIDDAHGILDRRAGTPLPRLELLADATRSLVAGNAADPATVRRVSAAVDRFDPADLDRIDLGVVLLCAYGLISLYEVRRSAALLAGFDWERTMVIDRAIVAEILVHAAIRDDDPVAAEAWLATAERFAGDPIADSTLDRARSRMRLFLGDVDGAIEHAERAARRATEEGRTIEAAEAEMLAARARIAAGRPGEAARRLESVVARTAPGGFRGARRAAARQLRGIGRRLRPAPGSGETALSERERDVLALILDGCDTAQIAARLHISPHTARVHTSRVLAAHAAPSRRVLASRVAAASGDPARAQRALAELTPRQRAVALEVASGATNLEIAQRLGLSTRTVEKHLTDAMRRWGVTTRVAVVLRAGGLGEEPAAASAALGAE